MAYELVDHTSEITLRLRAPTFAEIVAEATRGLADLVPATVRGAASGPQREFRIRAIDRVAALVDWLNEMLYLCEAEEWLPLEVEVTDEGEGGLQVRARGAELAAPWVAVKAATLHGAYVREKGEELEAEVTLDV